MNVNDIQLEVDIKKGTAVLLLLTNFGVKTYHLDQQNISKLAELLMKAAFNEE